VSSRTCLSWSDHVGEQLPVDNVGQSPFQTAHRFHRRFPRGFLPVVVGAAFAWAAHLHDGHDVQHPVDLPVPAARQPVPDVVPGRGVDGRGAGPGREVRTVGECSSSTTGRRPLIRVPTSATECASVASVLHHMTALGIASAVLGLLAFRRRDLQGRMTAGVRQDSRLRPACRRPTRCERPLEAFA